jgi:SAM-dependent methyltransferase
MRSRPASTHQRIEPEELSGRDRPEIARKDHAMNPVPRLIAVLAVALVVGCGTSERTPDVPVSTGPKIDVIWVPSEVVVARKMLEMAGVGRDDVVYDLGSGDGRIPIMAAREFGARGVGVDIDPALIRQARDNAVKAGVANRVTFVEQDLFTADIGDATVVAIYLGRDVNLRLRPKLQRELRPGTRIVSHDYDLGDWLPDQRASVTLEDRDHLVFLWRVPPR